MTRQLLVRRSLCTGMSGMQIEGKFHIRVWVYDKQVLCINRTNTLHDRDIKMKIKSSK